MNIFNSNCFKFSARSCNVDGKVYQEFDNFISGIGGCAKCVCTQEGIKCDLSKCQEIVTGQQKLETKSSPKYNDYTNIKDQIAKQYFTDYDAQRLKAIITALGCNFTDCPQLIAATDIKYNLLDSVGREYVGRSDKLNKIVFHSTNIEAENNSPSQQVVTSIPYFMTMTQSFEVTITKTKKTYSEDKTNYWVYKKKASTTFTQEEEQKYSETNETIIYYPSQHISIGPSMKMNTTFNFFQYDDINNYFLHFQIANNSTLIHPEVDASSRLINVTKPLGDFLKSHTDFLSTLKYENDTALKLVENEGNFILKNFPTTESLTNYGVDVEFGRAQKLQNSS